MEDEEDLETLGEQLYSLIYPKHKEDAGKLTGMLLELPGPVLSQMLQDESLLMAAVEKALRALQLPQEPCKVTCKDEDDVSVSSDSLGEQLFELVDVYNTGHSQKITGMLLEQHKDAVLNLLSDPKVLEEQVTLALKTLKEMWRRLTSVTHLRLMILTSWERSSSCWWRKLIHFMQMISQVCCWRWRQLPSNSCSLTTQFWKMLFRKHKEHWKLRTELSVLQ
ncbi:uncharacterized protein LOC111569826 isoform X1 [Amphiprion ocellaris]|uniref:PABC domain-containing protein n=1 Tax=Amphiprion ocellaris TaxID=80972 RepID=A0AAQ6AEE1_AMPOC|nr:uncharacterized protein LOC111569826 isoform X1 [Amphiprion ocellaris]